MFIIYLCWTLYNLKSVYKGNYNEWQLIQWVKRVSWTKPCVFDAGVHALLWVEISTFSHQVSIVQLKNTNYWSLFLSFHRKDSFSTIIDWFSLWSMIEFAHNCTYCPYTRYSWRFNGGDQSVSDKIAYLLSITVGNTGCRLTLIQYWIPLWRRKVLKLTALIPLLENLSIKNWQQDSGECL
jgi:hypothetical protein